MSRVTKEAALLRAKDMDELDMRSVREKQQDEKQLAQDEDDMS